MNIYKIFRKIYFIGSEKPDTTTEEWYAKEIIYIYLIPFLVAFINYRITEFFALDTNSTLTLILLVPTGLVFLSYFYLKSYN